MTTSCYGGHPHWTHVLNAVVTPRKGITFGASSSGRSIPPRWTNAIKTRFTSGRRLLMYGACRPQGPTRTEIIGRAGGAYSTVWSEVPGSAFTVCTVCTFCGRKRIVGACVYVAIEAEMVLWAYCTDSIIFTFRDRQRVE
jgi:hypothetical protein